MTRCPNSAPLLGGFAAERQHHRDAAVPLWGPDLEFQHLNASTFKTPCGYIKSQILFVSLAHVPIKLELFLILNLYLYHIICLDYGKVEYTWAISGNNF